MTFKSLLRSLIFVLGISLVLIFLYDMIKNLFQKRDEHYDKIYKGYINGHVTDIGVGRYTSIQTDNGPWYDAGFKKIKPEFNDSLPNELFEINDSILKNANSDTLVLVRKGKKYFCIL